MIASEVLAPGIDGTTGIQAMLRHEVSHFMAGDNFTSAYTAPPQYANYPLQRLIKHTTGNLHLAIVDQVSMQLAMFREANPPFNAKHLVAGKSMVYLLPRKPSNTDNNLDVQSKSSYWIFRLPISLVSSDVATRITMSLEQDRHLCSNFANQTIEGKPSLQTTYFSAKPYTRTRYILSNRNHSFLTSAFVPLQIANSSQACSTCY